MGQRRAGQVAHSASRARIRSGPAARCSPSATEDPTRAATLASPFSSRDNTVNGRSQSGGGSRGRSRCASAGRICEDTDPARARALPADGDGRLVVDEAAAVLSADPPALVHLTALAS
jgi:hypothetical protein